jgi:hypothetical protein
MEDVKAARATHLSGMMNRIDDDVRNGGFSRSAGHAASA